jgi:hypothetical protein
MTFPFLWEKMCIKERQRASSSFHNICIFGSRVSKESITTMTPCILLSEARVLLNKTRVDTLRWPSLLSLLHHWCSLSVSLANFSFPMRGSFNHTESWFERTTSNLQGMLIKFCVCFSESAAKKEHQIEFKSQDDIHDHNLRDHQTGFLGPTFWISVEYFGHSFKESEFLLNISSFLWLQKNLLMEVNLLEA